MLRTVFMIGLIAFAGLFLLRLSFGILGVVFKIFFALLWMAIPVLIIGSLIYLALKIFAPETAKDLKSKFGGE